jgi:hypothetical protein
MRPVQAGAGQEAHRAAIDARMHAVAVEFDLVQPVRTVRGPPARAASVAAGSIPAKGPRLASLPIVP